MKMHTISYAYPSSPLATTLQRKASGCWALESGNATTPHNSYAEALQAVAGANSQPSRWSVDNVLNAQFAPEAA